MKLHVGAVVVLDVFHRKWYKLKVIFP